MISPISAALYIHIPFCRQKCRYCDFLSIPLTNSSFLEEYVRALLVEMELRAPAWYEYRFDSIYLGGGTPSLLSLSLLKPLMAGLAKYFTLNPAAEISIEVNPATIHGEILEGYRDLGINRVSLGVQSLSDSELTLLGRQHQVRHTLEIVEALHHMGWSNFGIDLIYGLSGQSIDNWKNSLEQTVGLKPAHISSYLLQLEPDTPMARDIKEGRLPDADEDQAASMYDWTRHYLAGLHYEHYEISNFSRPGLECRHNLAYWQGVCYLGLGSAAVSRTVAQRTINAWPIIDYIKPLQARILPPHTVLEEIGPRDELAEAFLMGLRLCQGVSLKEVGERSGLEPLTVYGSLINKLISQGFLWANGGRIRLNPDYYFVSNQVLCQFIA